MTDRRPHGLGVDLPAWLADGPERAPATVLAATFDRTRATGQRPGWLARGLGAPEFKGGRVGSPVRLWLVATIVLSLLALIALAMAGIQRPPLLVVAPTTQPSPTKQGPTRAEPTPEPTQQEFRTTAGFTATGDADDPWLSVGPGWNGNETTELAYDFRFGPCARDGCTEEIISVAVGSVERGQTWVEWQATCPYAGTDVASFTKCATWEAEVGPGPVWIDGQTTDELVAAWRARYGHVEPQALTINAVPWVFLDNLDRLAAIAVYGTRIVSVTSQPATGLAIGARETRFRLFVANLRFDRIVSTAPASGTLRDLQLTMPPGWVINAGPGMLYVNEDTGSFLTITARISVLSPGDRITISRPTSGGGQRDLRVGGATFEELVASIADGAPDASRQSINFHGTPGYRWSVPQFIAGNILVGMAAVEWKDHFYVIELHFPVDGAPGGAFALLLEGVTLQ